MERWRVAHTRSWQGASESPHLQVREGRHLPLRAPSKKSPTPPRLNSPISRTCTGELPPPVGRVPDTWFCPRSVGARRYGPPVFLHGPVTAQSCVRRLYDYPFMRDMYGLLWEDHGRWDARFRHRLFHADVYVSEIVVPYSQLDGS